MKKFRIGLVGTGSICNDAHIPPLKSMPEIEIAAICDIDPKALERTKKNLGNETIPAFLDHREMIKAGLGLDAVHVCTPNYAHSFIAVDFLNADVNVFVEKPMSINAEEGRKMLEAEKKSKAVLSVGHCWRYNNEMAALKKFVDAGRLGNIYYAKAISNRRRGIPGWGVFTDLEKQGGGPMIDCGCHALDTALWLVGNPKPISVMGCSYSKLGRNKEIGDMGGAWSWDRDNFNIEDFCTGYVRFENDMTMYIESSFAAHIEKDYFGVQLIGDKGGATTAPLKIFTDENRVMLNITPFYLQPAAPHADEIKDFYKALAEGSEIPIKAWQAYDVIHIIDAIYESARTGETIKL
ncbi:MAG: Gfo/Idh/MocA family oxidoreductase [Abditibacteriota bacterium]|nr:Gfo/Idh/MocA family oxidoreductase [Abditibacteriota bacterium]